MKELLDEIIHELRTPAVSIKIGASGLKEFLPKLIAAYREAQKHALNVPIINEKIINSLEKVLDNIESESIFIDHYLNKLSERSIRSE